MYYLFNVRVQFINGFFFCILYRKCGFKAEFSRNKWLYTYYIKFLWLEFGISTLPY